MIKIKNIIAWIKITIKMIFSTKEERKEMKEVLRAYKNAVSKYEKEHNVSKEVAEQMVLAPLNREVIKTLNKREQN